MTAGAMNLMFNDARTNQSRPEYRLGVPVSQPFLRNAFAFCLFVAAFYFAYRYGMAFSHATASPFWFPDSVLLCALLLVRPGRCWVIILATLPIRLLAPVSADIPLWFLLATFAIDSAKGLLAAMTLRRFLRNPICFETVREFALYCLFVVLLIPATSAFAGAAARHFLGHDFWLAWEQWFLGNTLAHLVVTPVIFYWVLAAPWNAPNGLPTRWIEGGFLTAGLIATAYVAFNTDSAETGFAEPRFYAPVPFLFWAAIRFGIFGATGAVAVIAFFSVAAALQSHGPFSGQSPADTALALQNFLLLRAAPLYLVAVLIEQRNDIEQTLRKNETALRESYARIQDLAGRLITTQEAERSRIASDLHDDVNQQLAGLSIALSNVKRRLQNGGDATVPDELTRLQQRTIDLSNVIRDLSHELHPGVLQHVGLAAALNGHCAEVGRQYPIEVTFSAVDVRDGIPQEVALCLYRVAQEALRNIAEHADAHRAQVTLSSSEKSLELVIADDGQGFDLAGAQGAGGLGLISLDERVRFIGGSLAIRTGPQHGTEVRVQVPLGGGNQ
jgi:two-component system sensor histidine kinase UhpB